MSPRYDAVRGSDASPSAPEVPGGGTSLRGFRAGPAHVGFKFSGSSKYDESFAQVVVRDLRTGAATGTLFARGDTSSDVELVAVAAGGRALASRREAGLERLVGAQRHRALSERPAVRP